MHVISEKDMLLLPGFPSKISKAAMAADANIGGKDAEKQYPNPDKRYKDSRTDKMNCYFKEFTKI